MALGKVKELMVGLVIIGESDFYIGIVFPFVYSLDHLCYAWRSIDCRATKSFRWDLASITGATASETNARRTAFANAFVRRPEFGAKYDALIRLGVSNYVAALMAGGLGQDYNLTNLTTPDPDNPDGTTKVTLNTNDLITRMFASQMSVAQVLRAIVQSDEITQNHESVNAFVASQYYGYLRRTPDAGGFNAWVNYLKQNPNDFRTMVNGFVNSNEYRLRFGPVQ